MPCGRPAWRCRLAGPTPSRVARSACGWSLPWSRRLVGLAVVFRGGHRLTHHPFARRSRRHRRRNFPRAPRRHTGARDRPVVPNQSATPGHCEPRASDIGPTRSARRLRSPPPRMRRRRCHPERRAPLLRFSGPYSVRWPRRVLLRWAAGPPDPPASALPRDTRAFRNEPCRETRPCGFALSFQRMRSGGARCGGRAGVGVPAGSEIARGALFR